MRTYHTEDFQPDQRVKVKIRGHFMDGMIATVITHDAYSVKVRFDTITDEMKDYEDSRTGVCSFAPEQLEKL